MSLDKLIEEQIHECVISRNNSCEAPFITAVDTLILLLEPGMRQNINKYIVKMNLREVKEDYSLLFGKIIDTIYYGESWEV